MVGDIGGEWGGASARGLLFLRSFVGSELFFAVFLRIFFIFNGFWGKFWS